MNKKGIVTKLVYSNAENGMSVLIQLHYNTHTDHIGIYTGFQKSNGWNNGSINNKNCPTYLGITVAEQLLAQVFNHVERMPIHNSGFDFKCNQGYMIDVKASIKRKNRNGWLFNINYNKIADYFLCLAFDNRLNLNPLHIWLIPANKVNHLAGLGISESKLDKWSKFELTDKLNKVITCCNIMKET